MRTRAASPCPRPRCRCSGWCGIWQRWSAPGSGASSIARTSGRSGAFAAWHAEVEQSRRIEADAPSLDALGHQARWDQDVSLRLVMIHVLLEYARHNGHADFLREAIDGIVGA